MSATDGVHPAVPTTGAAAAPSAGDAPAPTARYVPGSGETRRHVLIAIVNNRPGVLNRVSSLMRARNFNIESLAVGHTENPDVSRMTITLRGDDYGVEQVGKQLYRLIDVLKVQDVTAERRIEHELALIKVRATNANRAEIVTIVELYKGRVVDLAADSVMVEATGTEDDIDRLVELVTPFGIRELVRTGSIVMLRGAQTVEFEEKV
jgi:acetolactate synthase I/III small subunit